MGRLILEGNWEMKDVVIIGSGIGGLIAGNLLAKKGHQVTIFEAHSMPGGYTAGFYRKGIILRAALCPLKLQHRYLRQ
jgi:phytoene dehydrogenase-like protein